MSTTITNADSSGLRESPAGTEFAPSYSRRARRERLRAALDEAAAGGPFELPKPQRLALPGPCGAVMNVLTEHGPLKTQELFDMVVAQYPGVLRSKTHLKENILKSALVNKVIKVRMLDAKMKDRWAIRRPGQTRMKIARQ